MLRETEPRITPDAYTEEKKTDTCNTLGEIQRACRVPLIEIHIKRLQHLQEEIIKENRIIRLLKKYPEFDEHEQLRELLNKF